MALAFLAVLAPLIMLGVDDLRRDDAERRESVLQDRLLTAQALTALVDASFDRAIEVADVIAVDPTVATLDPSRLDPYLARYAAILPEYDNINVWDAAGRNVGSSVPPPPGASRATITDREHFRRAMASGMPVVSDVLEARTTNRPAVASVAVIKGPAGERLGAVSLLLDLSVFPSRFRDVPLAPDQAIVVTDRAGVLAIHTLRPNLSWPERDASWYGPLQVALSAGEFAGVERGIFRGDEVQVVALARSAKHGWVAGIIAPEAAVLGPVRTRAAQQAAVSIIVLLVAGLLAVAFTNGITRPLRELTGAITAFGRGEMSRRVRIQTRDELEFAADTFNLMAETLQRQRERLVFFGDLAAELASSLLLDRILDILAEKSLKMMGDSCLACLLADGEEGCRAVKVWMLDPTSKTPHSTPDGYSPVLESVVLPVIARGQSVRIPDVRAAELAEEVRGRLLDEGVTSLIAVPVRAHGRIVGLISALSRGEERRLGEEQLEIARGIAEIGGVAVENGLLFEELGRERSRLNAVIDRMAEGITVADGTGRILQLNRRAREILGVPAIGDEPLGLDAHLAQIDLRYPDGSTVPMDQRPIARAIRGEIFSGEEGVVVRPDGTRTHLLFSSGVVRDETGVQLAMTIYMDITPIKELEQTREEFISVVAHDLRAPITIVLGFASALRDLPSEMHGTARERKAVESIIASTRRLERMVADLLDASRIEAKRLVVSKEAVDLAKLTKEVVERSGALTNGHPVRIEVQPGLPSVEADPARIEQILANLLSNAGKYSVPGSEILVETSAMAGEVLVSVVNEGQGIPPEERDELFSRFYRARSARDSGVSGLGLGLYITRGLVEAHGGRIWVESEVGKYAAFRFTLPAVPGAP